MWRLRIAEGGGDPWLRTKNAHVGRQVWEFDAAVEPDPDVEAARRGFTERRHHLKHSADLIMRLQFAKENPLEMDLPAIKLEEHEDVTEEAVLTSLKRIIALYVSGALNTVLSAEHQKEIRRYLYNHQARIQLQNLSAVE